MNRHSIPYPSDPHRDTALVPLAVDWLVLDPILSETLHAGPIQDLDGLSHIPDNAGRRVWSKDGILDFISIFGQLTGFPVTFALHEFEIAEGETFSIGFGADWTSQWWLNGILVCDRSNGNEASTDDMHGNPLDLPVKVGRNLLVVRVGSGSKGWSLRVGRASTLKITAPLPANQPVGPWISDTRTRDYKSTGFRLENRNHTAVPGPERWDEEARFRSNGVEARWIEIVDNDPKSPIAGSPLYPNNSLPHRPDIDAGSKERLQSWIRHIHESGMPAITWFSLNSSGEAMERFPEWRVVPMNGSPKTPTRACFNTPYGDHLIQFVLESIRELGIDGFWFDWAGASGDALGCCCPACTARFENETGLKMPTTVDLANPVFRRWMKWRSRAYTSFWGKLANTVKRAAPHVTISMNHHYRGPVGWASGGPLYPTGLPIICGTEASSVNFTSSFMARLARAHQCEQAEVWMALHSILEPYKGNASAYGHHALSCITAGAMPSFGGEFTPEETQDAYQFLGSIINSRKEYVGGESVPYAALLVSEQSDLFDHSNRPDRGLTSGYWESLQGWELLLREEQLLTDFIFDADLRPERLARYSVLIVTGASCLSDAQLRAVDAWVLNGGVLVADRDFATLDEWGEHERSPISSKELNSRDILELLTEAIGDGWKVTILRDTGWLFYNRLTRETASSMAKLLTSLAPPMLIVEGSANAHVGLFRRPGGFTLHVQNSPAYSTSKETFPNPILHPPAPIPELRVSLKGVPAISVFSALESSSLTDVKLQDDYVVLSMRDLRWGDVVQIDV